MAAVTAPSSPLDLSHISYDKCVASLQSRPGPIRADDKLDIEHNWTSMHMNDNSDVPVIGHTHGHIRNAQRTNCKNSRPKQTDGLMYASTVGHARVDALISWPPKMHAYSMQHVPVGVMLTCCHQIRLQLGVPLP